MTSELGTFLLPILPTRRTELAKSKVQNFVHFSRHKAKVAEGEGLDQNTLLSSRSVTIVRESIGPGADISIVMQGPKFFQKEIFFFFLKI